MKKKIKVIHIRDSSGIFGAERVILTLSNNLDAEKIELGLMCLRRRDGRSQRLIDTATALNLKVFPVDVQGRFDIKAVRKMRSFLKSEGIDIIHTHDFKSDFYGLLATLGTSVHRITTAHGSTRDSLLKRFYLFVTERGTYRFFHRVIAVSRDLKNYLISRGIPSRKIETIQNGMDFSLLTPAIALQEEPLPDFKGQFVFAVVGRLFPDKGHRYFLEAFKKLHSEDRKTVALIVGDGPEKEKISEHISQLNLNSCVYLCGVRNDIGAVYDQSHCLVIPSLTEGLPYVLLEAMARKVFVVASKVGDIPLLLKNGWTGYLVNPGDVEDLYQKMALFIKEQQACQVMAERAFEVVNEKYSALKMAEKTENLYEELVC